MSTQMLWQMSLHSTSLTIATGVLLRTWSRNFALIVENVD
jgi:hypothetical protein